MLQHAGLDDALLGPRLARLLAANSPLPAREMVARGLAPLAGAEPWLALYQLWVRGGPTLAEQAGRTAGELPAAAVMTALADPHLPAVVLDFMARRRIHSPETLRLLVYHPKIHDSTLAALARCAPEVVCSAIAKNQRRWLACPAIAEQLVHNPCCDRATAHAVLELGAREAIAGLTELRRRALAGAVLQDSPELHARATAWMLRSGPADPFPELAPARAAAPSGLSLRAGPSGGALDLPAQADAAPAPASRRPPLPAAPAPDLRSHGAALPDASPPESARLAPPNARDPPQPGPARPLAHFTDLDALGELDDLDDLDLPLGDDWDEELGAGAEPPAPRGAVPLPELELPPPRPLAPRQLELPRAAASPRESSAPLPRPGPRTGPRAPTSYARQVQLVLDPATPLPLAMSLLHRLRPDDLRRVVTAPRLPAALVVAARRRTAS